MSLLVDQKRGKGLYLIVDPLNLEEAQGWGKTLLWEFTLVLLMVNLQTS